MSTLELHSLNDREFSARIVYLPRQCLSRCFFSRKENIAGYQATGRSNFRAKDLHRVLKFGGLASYLHSLDDMSLLEAASRSTSVSREIQTNQDFWRRYQCLEISPVDRQKNIPLNMMSSEKQVQISGDIEADIEILLGLSRTQIAEIIGATSRDDIMNYVKNILLSDEFIKRRHLLGDCTCYVS